MINLKDMAKIALAFENCEDLEVSAKDIRYLHAAEITESLRFNNVLCEDSVGVEHDKTAGSVYLIVKNKPEYSRILNRNDIAQIHVYDSEGNHEWFFVDYSENDRCDNENQFTEIVREDIRVRISKEETE